MPVTRAQANGTEPLIKVKTKIRKKKTEVRLRLSESEPESVSEPIVSLLSEAVSISEPIVSERVFEPLSPCDPTLLPPCTSEPIVFESGTRFKSKNPIANLSKMIIKGHTPPDWKIINHVINKYKLDKYMFMKDEAFKQNNKVNCQICDKNDHEMRAKYTDMCSCGFAFCMRRHRAYICCGGTDDPKKQKVKLYVKGKCSHSQLVTGRAKKDRRTKDRGISPFVKTIIQRMIKENIDLTPKMCHLMLNKREEVSTEFMPFLHQVYFLLFFIVSLID